MNADLMRDVEVALPGGRELLADLLAAPQARVPEGFAARVMARVERDSAEAPHPRSQGTWFRWGLSLAACLAVLLAAGLMRARRGEVQGDAVASLVACQRPDGFFSASAAAPYVQAFAVKALASRGHTAALDAAVAGLVRTQNAEGGWAHGAVNTWNVAALEAAAALGVPDAARAYRRGCRYLRLHGLVALKAGDLVEAARTVRVQQLRDLKPDEGILRSVALCAQ